MCVSVSVLTKCNLPERAGEKGTRVLVWLFHPLVKNIFKKCARRKIGSLCGLVSAIEKLPVDVVEAFSSNALKKYASEEGDTQADACELI